MIMTAFERPEDGSENPAPNLSLWAKHRDSCMSHTTNSLLGRCAPRLRAILPSLSLCGE